MSTCPTCQSEVPEGNRFCGSCGSSLAPTTALATETRPQSEAPAAERPSTSASVTTRFLPGAVLAERYRIVGLLGRGGMGEVYRADDLKLHQPVALKFLPPALEQDPGRLERFLGEVRTARQVSHPNVCRVFDVGEADGQHLLSMEYVDGEDLSSLLQRIGRLPRDKAAQIARQLCAGLAAAHAKGILHRDLKPANVMIDGRGDVRLTDFGLAGLAGEIEGAEIAAGTPAYMAPEQLAGKEVSVASDVYALGLGTDSASPPKPLDVYSFAILFAALAGAVLLARANLRRGRGDRRGAWRLAVAWLVANTAVAVFGADHVPAFAEVRLVFLAALWGVLTSAMVWLVYIALEPWARRFWPRILISWSRLLAGRLRDPMIGRDVLIGGLIGVVISLLKNLGYVAVSRLGLLSVEPVWGKVGGYRARRPLGLVC